mgnify:CR=1 FL=1
MVPVQHHAQLLGKIIPPSGGCKKTGQIHEIWSLATNQSPGSSRLFTRRVLHHPLVEAYAAKQARGLDLQEAGAHIGEIGRAHV